MLLHGSICLKRTYVLLSAIGWVRLSTGWLIFDERYDIIVFCYPNQIYATGQKHPTVDENRRVSKVRTFKVNDLPARIIR